MGEDNLPLEDSASSGRGHALFEALPDLSSKTAHVSSAKAVYVAQTRCLCSADADVFVKFDTML